MGSSLASRLCKVGNQLAICHLLECDGGPSWPMTLKHLDCVVRLFSRVLGLLPFTSVTY